MALFDAGFCPDCGAGKAPDVVQCASCRLQFDAFLRTRPAPPPRPVAPAPPAARPSASPAPAAAPSAPSPAAAGRPALTLERIEELEGTKGLRIPTHRAPLVDDIWTLLGYDSGGLRGELGSALFADAALVDEPEHLWRQRHPNHAPLLPLPRMLLDGATLCDHPHLLMRRDAPPAAPVAAPVSAPPAAAPSAPYDPDATDRLDPDVVRQAQARAR